MTHVVVMGVAGCGKSVLGQRLAQRLGLPFIEGDSFHPQSNTDKMRSGLPLTDGDRAGWLLALVHQLQGHPEGAVLSCSALKSHYRDMLRGAVHPLYFVHLVITPAEAMRRVGGRTLHFYPLALVHSQFDALEDPGDEPGVVVLDGSAPLDRLIEQAAEGVHALHVPRLGSGQTL
jgi:gluconokinase